MHATNNRRENVAEKSSKSSRDPRSAISGVQRWNRQGTKRCARLTVFLHRRRNGAFNQDVRNYESLFDYVGDVTDPQLLYSTKSGKRVNRRVLSRRRAGIVGSNWRNVVKSQNWKRLEASWWRGVDRKDESAKLVRPSFSTSPRIRTRASFETSTSLDF